MNTLRLQVWLRVHPSLEPARLQRPGPLEQLPDDERQDILQHCRYYHDGPHNGNSKFTDLVPYMPRILEKIAKNLECFIEKLEEGLGDPLVQYCGRMAGIALRPIRRYDSAVLLTYFAKSKSRAYLHYQ